MPNKYVLFFLLFCTNVIFAQTIKGVVYDENKETIAGANVYLDGTSTGTITDEHGKYELRVTNRINTTLVIGYIGYESEIIENPFQNPEQKIYLIPKETPLKEVVVMHDGFSRADKLKIFREEFLGKTKAGKSCKILNESDISFSYDTKRNQLYAFSAVPILIQNNYLGYEIAFSLIEFRLDFTRKSIKSADIYRNFFAGTTFYKDISNGKRSYIDKRKKTFSGSQMQFFRDLSKNIWNKKNFQLYDGSYVTNANDHFQISKNSGIYVATIINETSEKKTQPLTIENNFHKSFNLLYNKSEQSNVVFNTKVFHIDEYGNNADFNVVSFGGALGRKRAGDMLPMDFVE